MQAVGPKRHMPPAPHSFFFLPCSVQLAPLARPGTVPAAHPPPRDSPLHLKPPPPHTLPPRAPPPLPPVPPPPAPPRAKARPWAPADQAPDPIGGPVAASPAPTTNSHSSVALVPHTHTHMQICELAAERSPLLPAPPTLSPAWTSPPPTAPLAPRSRKQTGASRPGWC